jgi:hypothetical protein
MSSYPPMSSIPPMSCHSPMSSLTTLSSLFFFWWNMKGVVHFELPVYGHIWGNVSIRLQDKDARVRSPLGPEFGAVETKGPRSGSTTLPSRI